MPSGRFEQALTGGGASVAIEGMILSHDLYTFFGLDGERAGISVSSAGCLIMAVIPAHKNFRPRRLRPKWIFKSSEHRTNFDCSIACKSNTERMVDVFRVLADGRRWTHAGSRIEYTVDSAVSANI